MIFKYKKTIAATIVLLVIAIPVMSSLDLFKSFKINDGGCLRVDGPRGMEDQTKWNKDVVLSTQKDGMWFMKPG